MEFFLKSKTLKVHELYLKRHVQAGHEGNKDHKCKSCGKLFRRLDALKRHIHIIHESQKDYQCESCKKSFSEARALRGHIHRMHDGNKD